MRIGAHAPLAFGRQGGDLGARRAVLVEQLVRAVAHHPVVQDLQVFGRGGVGDGHLMGAPVALDPQAVHLARPGPALGGAQDDHRPARQFAGAALSCRLLDGADLAQGAVEGGRELLMDALRLVAAHQQRLIAVALEQAQQAALVDARQHRGVGDLVAVEVQHRQHRPVARRVEELVGVPGGGQRAGLGLAVAHHAQRKQVGIVEHRAEGVCQGVAQLAALVDGAGRLGGAMAGHPTGKGEAAEQAAHALAVEGDFGITLAVAAFQPGAGHQRGTAVAGAGDEDGVQILAPDQAVHVRIQQVQAGRGAPVAETARLDVLGAQRLLEQRVVHQKDLSRREIVGGAPPGVEAVQFGVVQRAEAPCAGHRSVSL